MFLVMQVEGVQVEVALQWCSDAFSDSLLGFVNSIKTIDGGTHMDGFKAALTRTVNNLGRRNKTLKEGESNLSGDHIREGLSAIVSVKVWKDTLAACALGSNGHAAMKPAAAAKLPRLLPILVLLLSILLPDLT